MSPRDTLLALCVVLVWGVNFVVIKLGLEGMPPLLLGALRFCLVAFPAILFIKPPKIPMRQVLLYGLTISFAQFAFLFCSLKFGMPAGLASIILQSQAFFTVILGAVLMKEKILTNQYVAVLVAIVGMVILTQGSMQAGDVAHIPLFSFLLIMLAALSWATGNIVNKSIMQTAPQTPILSLVVWSGLVPIVPFFLSSWLFEGVEAMAIGLQNIQLSNILALMYLAFVATMIGYGLWGYLLSRYPTNKVAPLSLLVPVVGLITAVWAFDERLSLLQIIGAFMMMLAMLINTFGSRLQLKRLLRKAGG
ncbi:MAG: EamA family transporter [Neisseriaceae bacterium]|nr:EamA family transporter [Neisseriaceae bacterium]MBP6860839.1 EamA family transporter [Neisseriaceae bacterium]